MLRIPLPLSATPCPACGTYVPQAGRVCPVCGYIYPVVASDPTSDRPLTEAAWQALLARIDAIPGASRRWHARRQEADDDPDA